MEREADADIDAGRVMRFDSADDFLAELDRHRSTNTRQPRARLPALDDDAPLGGAPDDGGRAAKSASHASCAAIAAGQAAGGNSPM